VRNKEGVFMAHIMPSKYIGEFSKHAGIVSKTIAGTYKFMKAHPRIAAASVLALPASYFSGKAMLGLINSMHTPFSMANETIKGSRMSTTNKYLAGMSEDLSKIREASESSGNDRNDEPRQRLIVHPLR